jgi:uncharacterized Zn finger protein
VPGYLLRYAQQSDISFIREQVGDVQGDSAALSDNDFHTQYRAKAYATLIVQLEALYEPDPEVTLAHLREHGLYSLLVAKLLELDRSGEAVEVVEKQIVNTWERLVELPHLVAHGRGDDAIRLAREMLKSGYDERVAQWLLEQYQAQGDTEACFDLQRQRMFAQPSEPVYANLKAAAQAVQRWSETRQEIIKHFQDEKRFNVLITIYLHDSEWNAAWDILEKQASSKPEPRTSWMWNGLDLEVARRSQEARPDKAIPVFIKYARVEINNRDRKHYQAAARLLAIVQKLYQQTDNEDAWKQLIAGIRAEFPSLRALQEELTKAAL